MIEVEVDDENEIENLSTAIRDRDRMEYNRQSAPYHGRNYSISSKGAEMDGYGYFTRTTIKK